MNLSEDKRGIGLFLVPALMGWIQIVIILVGHLLFGDAGTLLGFGTMGLFLIVMAVLVSRDAKEMGIDAGGYIVFVFIMFLFGYPFYMGVRGRRGAALGLGAGMLAMFLFFVPLIVLPLGAKILAKRTASQPPPPTAIAPLHIPTPTTSPAAQENHCDKSTCRVYTLDDAAKTMLTAPENAKKAVDLVNPTQDWLVWLAAVPQLTELKLDSATQISDLAPLTKLLELQSLDVWNSKVKTLAPLADLMKLETLKLENSNSLVDLSGVAGLPNLKELHFMGSAVKDFGPIGGATHLRKLSILSVRAPLDPLGKLTSLQELDVDPIGSVAGLTPLTGLRKLNVWESHIQDPALLGKLVGLQDLNVSSAHLSTIAFASTLRQLKTIDLDYEADVKDLLSLRGLPELTDVEASGTGIDDIAPLAACPKLTRLNIDKTKVKTLLPLATVKTLTTLSVSGADVHELMPIAKLPALKSVNVHEGQISDAEMSAFKAAAPTVRVTISKS